MRACQPTEEGRHLAVCVRPDGEVPVVGQDAVGQDADRVPLVRLDHDPLERLEVGVLAEEVHLADRSVQHMVHLPAGCFSRCSWYSCTFPENAEAAATGQGVVSADFSTPIGERPSRARRGSPR